MSFASFRLPVAALLAGLLLCPHAAVAQQKGPQPLTRTQFGLGYVANAPDAMVGGSAYVLLPHAGGIGLYVDAKFNPSDQTSERGWDPSVTSLEVAGREGSKFIRTEESWKSYNVALMRPVSTSLIIYAGAGVAKLTRYDLYEVDPLSDIGLSGVAWTLNPATAETKTNLMVGIMMRLTSFVTAQFGYETQPSGVTVGASVRLPRW